MAMRGFTTVINDISRLVGQVQHIRAEWEIPVERPDRWKCRVKISVSHDAAHPHREGLWVSIYACGYEELPEGEDYSGSAFASVFSGSAPPSRLTREWIEGVLRREIETARLAALSFTQADLRPPVL